MKTNEAPEKLYLNWVNYPLEEIQVEYTHTDTFVEKAWSWIEDNILSSNQQDMSCSYYKQFRNYMKGE